MTLNKWTSLRKRELLLERERERERDQRGKERQKEYFYRHVGLEEKKIQAENSFHPFRN
jgi:hypothetical protein